jgi:hypothetical protein
LSLLLGLLVVNASSRQLVHDVGVVGAVNSVAAVDRGVGSALLVDIGLLRRVRLLWRSRRWGTWLNWRRVRHRRSWGWWSLGWGWGWSRASITADDDDLSLNLDGDCKSSDREEAGSSTGKVEMHLVDWFFWLFEAKWCLKSVWSWSTSVNYVLRAVKEMLERML